MVSDWQSGTAIVSQTRSKNCTRLNAFFDFFVCLGNETTPIPRIYDEECEKAMLSSATIAVLPSEREMSTNIFKSYT